MKTIGNDKIWIEVTYEVWCNICYQTIARVTSESDAEHHCQEHIAQHREEDK